MFNYFKSTNFKLLVARYIYKLTKILCIKQYKLIKRNNVFFEVDISEGIELSLYLFGNFQKHIYNFKNFSLTKNPIIFDIGANIGSICLPMAAKYPTSKIYAFEPTNYAYNKLRRNISLNKKLHKRVFPIQAFVSSKKSNTSNLSAYSSWKLNKKTIKKHPIHGGILKKSINFQTTIDEFMKEFKINKLDLVKIDTDGYEYEILLGAINSINKFKPLIVFELALYILKDKKIKWSQFEKILKPIGYNFIDTKSGKYINPQNIVKLVPEKGSIDIAAIPINQNI